MAFWIFMFVMNMLIPFSMIGFGRYFIKKAPKEINSVFGYRTSMSMKNRDTWEFAHRLCGKIWHTAGWILLLCSAAAMLPVMGKDQDTIGYWGGAVCCLQMIPLLGSIIPVERGLKKTFDKYGNRR